MINLSPQKFATWAEPIEMLYACHDKVRKFCRQLTILPDYLKEHGCNQIVKNDVKQILNYFTISAPLHHEDEEKNFFPHLIQYDPTVKTKIDELQQQHEQLHQYWIELSQELNALISKKQSTISPLLIKQFVEGYKAHLTIEEPLFELGKNYLSRDELQEMGQIMAKRRQI